MALTLSRIDRLIREYTVSAVLPDGADANIDGVGIALLPPRTTPTGATTWTPASYAAGVATVLLAGPDAAADGALTVPAAGADVWLRVTDNPEQQAVRVERLTVS